MLRINKDALTFDDVLILPNYSDVLPNEVDITTHLTNNIKLNIPILSAAMDTVTESKLAIALAREGGIGFIHKNMSIDSQVNNVIRVKRYESGIVKKPVCVNPNNTVLEIKELIIRNGFASYPVVNENNELLGIITSRDIKYISNLNKKVFTLMTPKENLLTVHQNEDMKIVLDKMYKKRVEKALVVDKDFHLLDMITLKDFQKAKSTPNACKDKHGRLRVGAAVGINSEERIEALVEAEVDVILIDSSHGHSYKILKYINEIRSKYPDLEIIGGNVATSSGALALASVGVNAIKVGIGPGSICTTRIVTGVGVPQITAISDTAQALKEYKIPIIADGGIRFSGDIAKAIAAGANCVMLGLLLAGTEESPGEIELFQGRSFKSYRGMGTIKSMSKGSSDRYFQHKVKLNKLVPEGVEARIPFKGKLRDIIYQQIGGLRSCMGLTGCHNINDLRTKTKFVRISNAGIKESHVHDVFITKEPPNYNLDC